MGSRITRLDSIARRLAGDAGIAWSDLNDYPGFLKNVWREEARRKILETAPDATFRGGRALWDGKIEDCIVLNYTE